MLSTEAHSTRQRTHRPRPLPDLSRLPPDALLTRGQVAALTGYTVQTLKRWAGIGRGPRLIRCEGRPRYRVIDVQVWLGSGVWG